MGQKATISKNMGYGKRAALPSILNDSRGFWVEADDVPKGTRKHVENTCQQRFDIQVCNGRISKSI